MASGQGGRRRLPAGMMLARVAPLAAAAGVTRLADLTGLDRIGVPVFQAMRPLARSLAVSLGKGASRDVARLSALVETIELHRAEQVAPADPSRIADAEEAALWSRMLPVGKQRGFDPGRARPWLAARDLIDGRAMAVPFEAVTMDLARPPAPDIWRSSNGLASGSDRDEALVAALLELLEREALARWRTLPPAMKRATRLRLASIRHRRIGTMLARVARAGLRAIVWDMSEPVGVPAFQCALIETARRPAVVLPPGIGSGCDPDPAAALAAAIGEAAQARIMFIAGARDDLSAESYRDPAGQRLAVVEETLAFEAEGARDWRGDPAWRGSGNTALRDWLVARCAAAGAPAVACVDLADAASGLATVKLLAPGFGDDDRPSAFA